MSNQLIKSKGGGVNRIIFAWATFIFVAVIFVFLGYFMYAVFNDYALFPMYTASQAAGFSGEINTAFDTAGSNWSNFSLGFIDYLVAFLFMYVTVISFYLAYVTRGSNIFAFLTMLFYGQMFFLFVIGLVEITTNYIYDMMLALLPTMLIALPWFNILLSNLGIIFVSGASLMLLVNQMDFDIAAWVNRKRKERMAIGDDEIV